MGMGQFLVGILGLLREIPPPHLQLLLPSSEALNLSPISVVCLCLCKTHLQGHTSAMLWFWAPALTRFSFSDLVQ